MCDRKTRRASKSRTDIGLRRTSVGRRPTRLEPPVSGALAHLYKQFASANVIRGETTCILGKLFAHVPEAFTQAALFRVHPTRFRPGEAVIQTRESVYFPIGTIAEVCSHYRYMPRKITLLICL